MTPTERMPMTVRRRRVLVVGVRCVIEDWLRALGCVVLHAASSSQALAATRTFEPDAICLDLWLEGTSGLDVLTRLQARHPMVPVILISADPLRETTREARARGAFACLSKPLNGREVVRTLAAALGARRPHATAATG